MSQPIILARKQRVATLTIDRPPLNILDIETIQELESLLRNLGEEPDLQVVVLQGAGEKAFSAGVAIEDHTAERVPTMLTHFHGALSVLRDLPAVTLAAVQGHCLGGGMELAACCDLIVAADDSRFGQPEIELGCYPPLAAALYPALLGNPRTADLLLTGRILDGGQAQAMGLVSRLVKREELSASLDELVASITAHSLVVTRLTKRAIRAGRDHDFADALAASERIYLEELIETHDMHEGLAAFLEKRPPDWQHR